MTPAEKGDKKTGKEIGKGTDKGVQKNPSQLEKEEKNEIPTEKPKLSQTDKPQKNDEQTECLQDKEVSEFLNKHGKDVFNYDLPDGKEEPFLIKMIKCIEQDSSQNIQEYNIPTYILKILVEKKYWKAIKLLLQHDMQHYLPYILGSVYIAPLRDIEDTHPLKKELNEELDKYKAIEQDKAKSDQGKVAEYKDYIKTKFPNDMEDEEQFALKHALLSDNLYMLRLLIEDQGFAKIAKVGFRGDPEGTLLHIAFRKNRKEGFELLVKYDKTLPLYDKMIRKLNKYYKSVLSYAVEAYEKTKSTEDLDMIKRIVNELGGSPSITQTERTDPSCPFVKAKEMDNKALFNFFEEILAKERNQTDDEKRKLSKHFYPKEQPLIRAIFAKDEKMIDILLEDHIIQKHASGEYDIFTQDGCKIKTNFLHIAAQYSSSEVTKKLAKVAKPAMFNAKDINGYVPLTLAVLRLTKEAKTHSQKQIDDLIGLIRVLSAHTDKKAVLGQTTIISLKGNVTSKYSLRNVLEKNKADKNIAKVYAMLSQ
ncbi:MAG: hypothetical protein AAF335_00470 [Bacteroidota bacterium]